MSKFTDGASKKRKSLPDTTETTKRTKVSAERPKKSGEPEETKLTSISNRNALKSKSKKATSSTKKAPAPADDFAGFSDSSDEEIPVDTAALLAGFSSDSESDNGQAQAITTIPSLPDTADLETQLATAAADPDKTPGTIYVGRIPHGFYEPQMKSYFSQFGDITRLRLSRNRLSGKPKHYGFIEFASSGVAEIVAKTMDKYLMFGHILQVRKLRPEEVHAELWKGAGRRFKAMPRNKLEGSFLERGRGREGWEKRIKKEEKRRKVKGRKLEEMGYEFEMPELKQVDSVPKRIEAATGEDESSATLPAIDMADTTETAEQLAEEVSSKRKKGRKEPKVTKKARVSV